MKPGDVVKVEYVDGESLKGHFLREERGFFVFLNDSNEKFVCTRRSAKIEVLSKGK